MSMDRKLQSSIVEEKTEKPNKKVKTKYTTRLITKKVNGSPRKDISFEFDQDHNLLLASRRDLND